MVPSDATPESTPDHVWYRWYPPVLLGLWVLIPELRRLVDWQVGFNSLPVINLIPIVALIPLLFVCIRQRDRTFSRDFLIVAGLWFSAFAYALLVGALSGGIIGAVYELSQFCLPALLGLWIAAMPGPLARRVFERFVRAALWLGAIASIYGLYQFVAPPPWDVAWVENSGLGSIGTAEPFGLRIFGPMNSPGVFADFLAVAILFNLYRFRSDSVWLLAPLLICTAALTLTFDRTAWLALALGFVVYLAISPRRIVVASTVAVTCVVIFVLAANLSLLTGDPTSNGQLQSRISTLSNVQDDNSAIARTQETNDALRAALAEPLGQGLGTVGTATKLSAGSTTVLDNGYLARFLEMGFFGAALYNASLFLALLFAIGRFRSAMAGSDRMAGMLLATSIAVQVALLGAELSSDHHSSLMAIMYWIVVGITAVVPASSAQAVRADTFGSGPALPRQAHA